MKDEYVEQVIGLKPYKLKKIPAKKGSTIKDLEGDYSKILKERMVRAEKDGDKEKLKKLEAKYDNLVKMSKKK